MRYDQADLRDREAAVVDLFRMAQGLTNNVALLAQNLDRNQGVLLQIVGDVVGRDGLTEVNRRYNAYLPNNLPLPRYNQRDPYRYHGGGGYVQEEEIYGSTEGGWPPDAPEQGGGQEQDGAGYPAQGPGYADSSGQQGWGGYYPSDGRH